MRLTTETMVKLLRWSDFYGTDKYEIKDVRLNYKGAAVAVLIEYHRCEMNGGIKVQRE